MGPECNHEAVAVAIRLARRAIARFETVYHLLPDGTLKMLGAESFDVSEDGLVWSFKLNPNAKWTDGQPVTANDWAYSWLRALKPETGSGVA